MAIQIDKKVPTPPPRSRGRRYPWEEMKVGDSFLVPAEVAIHNFRRAAVAAQKANGRKFSTRQTHEGYRCWRMA